MNARIRLRSFIDITLSLPCLIFDKCPFPNVATQFCIIFTPKITLRNISLMLSDILKGMTLESNQNSQKTE